MLSTQESLLPGKLRSRMSSEDTSLSKCINPDIPPWDSITIIEESQGQLSNSWWVIKCLRDSPSSSWKTISEDHSSMNPQLRPVSTSPELSLISGTCTTHCSLRISIHFSLAFMRSITSLSEAYTTKKRSNNSEDWEIELMSLRLRENLTLLAMRERLWPSTILETSTCKWCKSTDLKDRWTLDQRMLEETSMTILRTEDLLEPANDWLNTQ